MKQGIVSMYIKIRPSLHPAVELKGKTDKKINGFN